jgi:hypothetical protein
MVQIAFELCTISQSETEACFSILFPSFLNDFYCFHTKN